MTLILEHVVEGDLLSSCDPLDHLWEFVSMIRCTPRFLRKIDVQPFKHLCIVVVSGAELSDGVDIMEKGMELRDVQVIPYPESDDDVFVFVECIQGICKILKRSIVVGGVLRQINEVEKGPECEHSRLWNLSYQTGKENACHLLSLFARYLSQRRDAVLEVSDSERRRETSKAFVQLLSTKEVLAPRNEMLKYALVKLVQDVWSNG